MNAASHAAPRLQPWLDRRTRMWTAPLHTGPTGVPERLRSRTGQSREPGVHVDHWHAPLSCGRSDNDAAENDAKLEDSNDCRSDRFAQIMLEYTNHRNGRACGQPRLRRKLVGVLPVVLRKAEENALVSLKPSLSAISVTDDSCLANRALAHSMRRSL
jgi:hypothetical protein